MSLLVALRHRFVGKPRSIAVCALVIIAVAWASIPEQESSQEAGPVTRQKALSGTTETGGSELPKAKYTVEASLHPIICGRTPANPCNYYFVEVLDYHGTPGPSTELRITDTIRNKIIFVDHDVDHLNSIVPLGLQLLATSWGQGGTHAKVYRLDGDSVKVVFDEGSKFASHFIESDSDSNPVVLVDNGREMRGDYLLPTVTEIWQWSPVARQFVLRATVPITQKFASLASILGENVKLITEAEVKAVVKVGNGPNAVAVNAVTNKIYVANGSSNSLTVIDGATNKTKTIAGPVAGTMDGLAAIAVNPVTNTIYATIWSTGKVLVVDGSSDEVIATIAAGRYAFALAVNPATNRIYVVNSYSSVLVIDGSTNQVVSTFAVPPNPGPVAVNAASNRIYVGSSDLNGDSGTLTVIDGSTNRVVTTYPIRGNPESVAVNTSTGQIYVVASHLGGNGSICVIDGNNGATSTMALPSREFAVLLSSITFNPVTNTIYAVSENADSMTAIDGSTGRVYGTVSVGPTPIGVAVNPATGRIYVVNHDSSTATVVDGTMLNASTR